MVYYILVKRKGSKKWLGAVPAKKGATKAKLQSTISRRIRKGYAFKVVTLSQLAQMMGRLKKAAKRSTKRRTARRTRRRSPSKR